jgi:hypothetical protein
MPSTIVKSEKLTLKTAEMKDGKRAMRTGARNDARVEQSQSTVAQ